MVYAKIANRTVADEYFKVSEKVEALEITLSKSAADASRAAGQGWQRRTWPP